MTQTDEMIVVEGEAPQTSNNSLPLSGMLEALLFVSDEPVSVVSLAEVLEKSAAEVMSALRDLQASYVSRGSGVELREVAGGWRLFTAPAYHDVVARYVGGWDARRLTAAALETLAIVAYNQPITRAGISSIRGVSSDSSLNGLVEKGLVREAGTADAPGNPMLYVTTRGFLERFGLTSLDELPDVMEFAPDDATKALIRQRLGGEALPVADEAARAQESAKQFETMAQDVLRAAEGAAETENPLQSMFGVVEKIDFDSLIFESDDDD